MQAIRDQKKLLWTITDSVKNIIYVHSRLLTLSSLDSTSNTNISSQIVMQLTIPVITTITRGHLSKIQAIGIAEAGSMETTLTRPTEVLTSTLPPVMHKGITRITEYHDTREKHHTGYYRIITVCALREMRTYAWNMSTPWRKPS